MRSNSALLAVLLLAILCGTALGQTCSCNGCKSISVPAGGYRTIETSSTCSKPKITVNVATTDMDAWGGASTFTVRTMNHENYLKLTSGQTPQTISKGTTSTATTCFGPSEQFGGVDDKLYVVISCQNDYFSCPLEYNIPDHCGTTSAPPTQPTTQPTTQPPTQPTTQPTTQPPTQPCSCSGCQDVTVLKTHEYETPEDCTWPTISINIVAVDGSAIADPSTFKVYALSPVEFANYEGGRAFKTINEGSSLSPVSCFGPTPLVGGQYSRIHVVTICENPVLPCQLRGLITRTCNEAPLEDPSEDPSGGSSGAASLGTSLALLSLPAAALCARL